MGETNQSGEEDVTVDQVEGSSDQEETQTATGTESEEQGTSDTDDESINKQDDEDNDEDNKSESEPAPIVDEEPKTRKRNIDFIKERQQKKADKVRDIKDDFLDDEDEDEDYMDPDEKKAIARHVNRILDPILKKQMQDEDNQEIDSFIKQNPDFSPYIDKVKKFSQHESRKNLPIQSLFYEVAGPDLLRLGAKRAKKAGDEAKDSTAGGGTSNGGTETTSVWDLSLEDFAIQQENLRSKSR